MSESLVNGLWGELPEAGGEGTLDGVQSLRLDHYYY